MNNKTNERRVKTKAEIAMKGIGMTDPEAAKVLLEIFGEFRAGNEKVEALVTKIEALVINLEARVKELEKNG